MEQKDKDELERIGGQDALDAARDLIEWILEMTKKYEPYATNSIKLYEAFLLELPGEAENLIIDTE